MPLSPAPARKCTSLRVLSPARHAKFHISKTAEWPSVVFQADFTPANGEQISWHWSIRWDSFTKHGVVKTASGSWDAKEVIENLGGTLTVNVIGPTGAKAVASVLILGTQPDVGTIRSYLSTCLDSSGFDKILNHESHMKHFDALGYPKKTFDGGFGIAQLTEPKPDYPEVWNWKLNIDKGLGLFAKKRAVAVSYLSQSGRKYTGEQLRFETVCGWNGGHYHIWDQNQGWIRNPNILCDGTTGNIGWDVTDPANNAKTESELHKRDASFYKRRPSADALWGYSGVCYADAVLSSK